jgi:hypothetical protein
MLKNSFFEGFSIFSKFTHFAFQNKTKKTAEGFRIGNGPAFRSLESLVDFYTQQKENH